MRPPSRRPRVPQYRVRLESVVEVEAWLLVEAIDEDEASDIAEYSTDLDALRWTVVPRALPDHDFTEVADIDLVEEQAADVSRSRS